MTNETVPVTEADRETYVACIRLKNGDDTDESALERLRAGSMDNLHGVQIAALARHRLSTHPDHDALVEENARLRELLRPFARIADMAQNAGPSDRVMVNVARCRDARAALATGEA